MADRSTPEHLETLGGELCGVIRRLHAQGWCQGTGGNFSVRVREKPLRLLITRSGRNKREIELTDLMVVGADGQVAEGGGGRPSAETTLHVAIAELAGAGTILHTHSVWNTLVGEHFLEKGGLVIKGYEMLKGLEGVRTHEAEVFVPVLENSQDMERMAGSVRDLLARTPGLHGFLVAGHGLYAWGRGLEDAERHVEIFEFLLECVGRRTRFRPFEA